MVKLTDWRGNPITEGCLVIYPGRVSSNLWMNEARVVEIGEEPHPWRPDKSSPYVKVRRTRALHFGTAEIIKDSKVTKIDRVDRLTVMLDSDDVTYTRTEKASE